MTWYSGSREAIQRVYKDDSVLFTGLLAATSPRSSLKANLTLARRAYEQIKATGNVSRSSFMLIHYRAIQQVLETGEPHGQKVNAFYHNLLGDESRVTLDRHMARYLKQPTDSFSKQEYQDKAITIQWQALALGVSPAQHQADLWQAQRGTKDSYADHLRQFRLF